MEELVVQCTGNKLTGGGCVFSGPQRRRKARYLRQEVNLFPVVSCPVLHPPCNLFAHSGTNRTHDRPVRVRPQAVQRPRPPRRLRTHGTIRRVSGSSLGRQVVKKVL